MEMKLFDKQYYAIQDHGKNLQAIFPKVADMDPIALCKKLRRIEVKLNRIAERECSDEAFCLEMGEEGVGILVDKIMNRMDKWLGFRVAGVPVFYNGDPRGYALKIQSEYISEHNTKINRDWGGYGILAPEIGKDGR
jgi:hypothetical protein